MKDEKKKGVGVIITNEDRNSFYIQQKDDSHPIKELRLKYCFFGGAIEKGEDELTALKRELNEELGDFASDMISKKAIRLFESSFINIIKEPATFVFYEAILSDEELLDISKIKIKEGKRGCLVGIKELQDLPFFKDLKHMLEKYLVNIKDNPLRG